MRNAPKVPQQLKYANSNKIPYAVLLSHADLKEGKVAVKDLTKGDQENVPRLHLVSYLKKKISQDANPPSTTPMVTPE